MFRNLLEGWYGYPHIHCTFPITLRDASQCDTSSSSTRTYFVCLDCGKEFPYDWREMKVLKRFPATRPGTGICSQAFSLTSMECVFELGREARKMIKCFGER